VSAGAPTLSAARRAWAAPQLIDTAAATPAQRPWIRLCTFTALAGYGVQRWASLLRPAPTWRLVGLLVVAVVMAAAVPFVARRSRPVAAAVGLGLVLAAFPVAGLRWHWFTHLRVAVSADRIGSGLQALPNSLVPYLGSSHAIRLVIVLGAAVLLLDAAAVLASAGRAGSDFGDGRRAAAALPLTALAVVPSTLIRPEFPYLQGLLLFALLAAFLWGERVRRGAVAAAVAIVALAGVAGAIAAPRIDPGRPWVNYRAWTGTVTTVHVDRFNWNQTYGPLHWPQSGHQVLAVQARAPEYWKAEDLDAFNGYSWIGGTPSIQSTLPQPTPESLTRWTQTIRVTILGMQTTDVVAAGYAAQPSPIRGGFGEGADPGTWIAGRTLGPGTVYEVSTYSPQPSAHQLLTAGRAYPAQALSNDLTLGIPLAGARVVPAATVGPSGAAAQVTFPVFGTHGQPKLAYRPVPLQRASVTTSSIEQSPYGRVYRVARELAAAARSPYAFVAAVQRYLSVSDGFSYNANPPAARYPLASFLFTSKQGYCQQFSGAMAMLLRMGGIPARVAAGFTAGAYDASRHRWVVTDIDAHAWVEAWFPGYGWVRFDPTPTSAPARGGAVAPPIIKAPAGIARATASLPHREIGSSSSPGRIAGRHAGGSISPWWIALAVAAILALGWPLARIVRASAGTEDLLTELERALARTRRPVPDGVTLVALEQRLSTAPEAAAYIRALRMARYGGAAGTPTAAQRRALRQELRRGLGLRGTVRALWSLPPWLPVHRTRLDADERS
jgi:protein-glutamine gamma-glutamyltransferase